MSTVDDPEIQLRVLETLEHAKNYNKWVADLVVPYLGDDPLEIGSGLGYFARSFLESGVPRITVSERDQESAVRLRAAFADQPRVEVQEIDIAGPPPELPHFSSVVALNVLEHVEDDVAALAAASRLVRLGGSVIVFVPAHPFAMSSFDRSIGHFRRYTKSRLTRTFAAAGLPNSEIRYVNAPGLLAWVVGMKLLRRTPNDRLAVRTYDRMVVPVARRVEDHVPLPFGQSLFAVAWS